MPASPAKGVACSTGELMRWDGRFSWRSLRVREPFEERARRLYSVGEGSPASSGGDVSLQAIRPLLPLVCHRHYCRPTFGPCQPPRLSLQLTDP
jgi:hypothetical protein